MLTDEGREAGNMVAIHAPMCREEIENPAQLDLFCTAEPDSTGESLGLRSIGDDHLVLAGGVPVTP